MITFVLVLILSFSATDTEHIEVLGVYNSNEDCEKSADNYENVINHSIPFDAVDEITLICIEHIITKVEI